MKNPLVGFFAVFNFTETLLMVCNSTNHSSRLSVVISELVALNLNFSCEPTKFEV